MLIKDIIACNFAKQVLNPAMLVQSCPPVMNLK